MPALTIEALDKNRSQVELFFEWIKQHLHFKGFQATSEIAVKPNIWCAVCHYVPIAIVKQELHINVSLDNFLQVK